MILFVAPLSLHLDAIEVLKLLLLLATKHVIPAAILASYCTHDSKLIILNFEIINPICVC